MARKKTKPTSNMKVGIHREDSFIFLQFMDKPFFWFPNKGDINKYTYIRTYINRKDRGKYQHLWESI